MQDQISVAVPKETDWNSPFALPLGVILILRPHGGVVVQGKQKGQNKLISSPIRQSLLGDFF